MPRYILRRLLLLVVVLFGLTTITFAMTTVVPGDPARLLAGPQATPEQVERLRADYGLDRPVHERYVTYLSGVVRGDLGQSITTRRPVAEDIRQFLPATIELTLVAMVLLVVVGIPLGMVAALREHRWSDYLISLLSIGGISIPVFWLGIMVQILFFARLGWLPLGGRLGLAERPPPNLTGLYTLDSLLAGDWTTFVSAIMHLLLPAATLAIGSLGIIVMITRVSVLEALTSDYITTARSKGLRETIILFRHVLKNAMIPITTILGLMVGFLLSGNILIEIIFNWPGIGRYAVRAIHNLDFPAIMGVTLVIAVAYMLANLAVDLAYALLDPRMRHAERQQ